MKKIAMARLLLQVLLVTVIVKLSHQGPNDRFLVKPVEEKCKSRPKEIQYDGRNYFYSGHHKDFEKYGYDWLDARNKCREFCMETISFETQAEFDFFKEYFTKHDIGFTWTSGRVCDFTGCEGRWDLLPKRVKGWLWSGTTTPIDPTNEKPKNWTYQPWSFTGENKKPQPDNAEFFLNQMSESCLGILNNQYDDDVSWHDIACHQRARFICEDSADLLKELKLT